MHIEWPDQEISYTYAVGSASKDPSDSLNPGQPVLMASNTKTYVAATILRLVELKNIKLDQVLTSCLSKKTFRRCRLSLQSAQAIVCLT